MHRHRLPLAPRYHQHAIVRSFLWLAALSALADGRDAFARHGDIRPAFAQPLAVIECVARAVGHGVGVADAMTVDMRRDGEAVSKDVGADGRTVGRTDFDAAGAA